MTLLLENISLTLGTNDAKVNILNDISLKIEKGEIVSLLGPSGSGKSSLLMIMTALEMPQSGTVTIENQVLTTMSEDELARFRSKYIGIVFQSFHLLPTLTALENVMLPLELSGHKNPKQAAKEELEKVGLGNRLFHYPTQLSGGEQQRVALARAFAPRPAYIFADEPTGNLDEKTGAAIITLMFERQKETNATLVLVTHDEALATLCPRNIRLKNGRIEKDERTS